MNVFEVIHQAADQLQPTLIAQRRDFHKYAESGWLEMRTSSIIARKLKNLGYEVLTGDQVCKKEARMGVPEESVLEQAYQRAVEQGADPEFVEHTKGGMTGVIGILRCGEGPTVAMRFDIDALGVIESQEPDHLPVQAGFRSVNEGAMHACGHDGHTVIGLGVAQVLMQIRESLHGTVKLIFQPAEEGVRGAKSIVEKGHLDGVQYMIGSHVTPLDEARPEATVTPGAYGSLATCKYDVYYKGKAAHAGGAPQNGNNALLAAAAAVMNLQAIPRHGGGSTRINVGTLVAGTGRNVIADQAKMEIEVRGANTQINQYMCDYAQRILENTAQMHGCTCQIRLMGAADSMNSDEELCRRIANVCTEHLHMPVTEALTIRTGGSEDVAYMMNRVQEQGGQATFMRIRTKTVNGAHNRKFDFDEKVIPNAVKIFCGTVYDILK